MTRLSVVIHSLTKTSIVCTLDALFPRRVGRRFAVVAEGSSLAAQGVWKTTEDRLVACRSSFTITAGGGADHPWKGAYFYDLPTSNRTLGN
jgi:hypothetical protein